MSDNEEDCASILNMDDFLLKDGSLEWTNEEEKKKYLEKKKQDVKDFIFIMDDEEEESEETENLDVDALYQEILHWKFKYSKEKARRKAYQKINKRLIKNKE